MGWLDVSPARKPEWQKMLGLWAFTGISAALSGSIRAESLTRSEIILPTPARSIALIFPPTFSPLEQIYSMNANAKSIPALSVKLSAEAPANSGKFRRIGANSLWFLKQFVKFPLSESMQQTVSFCSNFDLQNAFRLRKLCRKALQKTVVFGYFSTFFH